MVNEFADYPVAPLVNSAFMPRNWFGHRWFGMKKRERRFAGNGAQLMRRLLFKLHEEFGLDLEAVPFHERWHGSGLADSVGVLPILLEASSTVRFDTLEYHRLWSRWC